MIFFFFFFNDTATTEIYTLSLHDALPICTPQRPPRAGERDLRGDARDDRARPRGEDRKSTRLNSSHLVISYAVFCLKKKKNTSQHIEIPLTTRHAVLSCRSARSHARGSSF